MVVGHHMGIVHAPGIRFRFQAFAIDKDILIVEAIRLAME